MFQSDLYLYFYKKKVYKSIVDNKFIYIFLNYLLIIWNGLFLIIVTGN